MIPAASLLTKHTVIRIAHTEIQKKLTVWSPLATDVRQSAAAVHGLAVAEIGGLVAIGTAVVPPPGGIIAKSAPARSVFAKSVLAISVAVPVVAVVAVIPVAITPAPAITVPRTRAGAGT